MPALMDQNVIPFGVYLHWKGQLVWIHAVSNVLNAAACFLIPVVILTVLARRRDIVPLWVGFIFCLPLLINGLAYTVMAINIWYPNYWLSGIAKLIGGIICLAILGLLIRLRPQLLKMPSPREALRNERKIGRMYTFLRGRMADTRPTDLKSSRVDSVGRYVRELSVAKKALEKSSESQSRFLANMSHEIRTPLAGIMGYSDQLLFDPQLQSPHREWVESIKKCTDHLKFLLNDILDVSKIEAGKLVIQKELCSLTSLLHDVVAIMHGRIQSQQLQLIIALDTPIPDRVVTDPLRLKQVLLNLLGNAAKFTESGFIGLNVAARGFEQSRQGSLDITVSDTGVGIPVEFQQNLFKRFSQAESASKMRNAGSGLGLFLSRTLARQLGGDVVLLSSEPGRGTSFLFTVAVDISADTLFVRDFIDSKPKADAPVRPNPIEGKLAGLSILVVEDGADNQRIFKHFLKMAGASITLVEDGPSALDRALGDESFDLVLMDIQIPLLDGYEVTRRLRLHNFQKPIIAVTAHSVQSESPQGEEAGISDFLSKPVEIENLIQTIMRHARRAEAVNKIAQSQDVAETESHLLSKYHNNHIYREIIVAFIKSFEQRIDDMQTMIDEMEWDKLSTALHQIKGAAATYGFPQVSEIAAQMEHTAKDVRRDAHAVQMIQSQAEKMRSMSLRMKGGLSSLENASL